jgi:hypothetical protein
MTTGRGAGVAPGTSRAASPFALGSDAGSLGVRSYRPLGVQCELKQTRVSQWLKKGWGQYIQAGDRSHTCRLGRAGNIPLALAALAGHHDQRPGFSELELRNVPERGGERETYAPATDLVP